MTKKGKLLQEINEAFANSNIDFIMENVTDDIKWNIIGDRVVQGKGDFKKAMTSYAIEEKE